MASQHMFLVRGLQKILDEKEIKRHPQAKKECQKVLDEIKAEVTKAEANGDAVPDGIVDADKYFHAFQLACATKNPKIQCVALDAIQKLLAYGYLHGAGPDPNEPSQRLIDGIIDAICGCFVGDFTDQTVALQIIKALLTAVTASGSAVHEGALLRGVRTCYNIHLASPSLVIQTTAKATLTQMLNVIFSRMEAQAAVIESEGQESPDPEGMGLAETDSAGQNASTEDSSQKEPAAVDCTETEETHKPENGDGNPTEAHSQHELPTTLVTPPSTQAIQEEPSKANVESALGPPSGLGGSPQIGGSNVSVASIDSTGRRLSLESAMRVSMDGNGTDPHVKAKFSHILQLDAYLVFRSLCKLSMKDLPPTTGPIDIKSHEMRSKQFIGAVKQYLCISLSKNGVSSVPQIFELSLAIFLCLLASFKFYLKAQIEVFFKDIFLPILETSASSFQHKWMVLQALSRIFGDPQTIIDIYLNYDCDLTLDNIFNHMIEDISKIAQGRAGHELGHTEQQEQHVGQMRRLGLECLGTCLAAMVEWINARDRDRERATEDMTRSNTLNTEDVAGNADERDPGTPDGGTTNGSTASLSWVDNPQDFEVKKKHKEIVEEALSLFNDKPKKGLKFAQDRALCGKSPSEVAEWFQKEDRLSKNAIGEFLGENDDYCKTVMYAYVDAMDFANHPFVDALRLFLEGFRLPGEAQKIDRLMEKFAARYCETNPKNEAFDNADTAYVLAYSIIMLTTDLHSTNVHKKMTIDEFVRNNRGINDGKDLPREFLVAIYEDIQANEIRVKEDRAQKKTTYAPAQLLNEKTRKALYRAEMETRLQSAQAVLTDKARASAHFIVGSHVAHVKPMFAACWTSCLAVFSLHFKDSTDMHTVRHCLEGLRHGIKIASTFFMDTERESFVLALTKFTTLLTPHPVLNSKTMECMKVLLACAGEDGNNLQKSWYQVLKCVSNLDLLINFGSGDDAALLGNDMGMNESGMDQRRGLAETQSFISSMKIPTSSAGPLRSSFSGSSITVTTAGYGLREEKSEDGTPSQTTTQGLAVACDRVFSGSVGLGGEAIVEFVRWLCVVSIEELQAGRPRMYSLSKIVEVAYYNMNRIRLEWSKVWAVLGEHFNKVGCMASLTISMFAVDSLRQLSMKFLERGELAHFHFQKDFLKPFEYIMNHNKNTDIRDMVVRCLANMVQAQAQRIRSGWKNIFFVFSLAALDQHAPTVHLAFSTTSKIFTEHGSLFGDTAFVDGVNCLVEFACNRTVMGLSMEALDLLQRCAVPMVPELVQYPADHVYNDDDRVWVQGWFPILFGLHRIMTRCPLEVRTRALTVLIEIINHHGSEFRPQHWKDLFRIMFRIFDDLKLPEIQAEKTEWINTTCHHALFAVLDIFGNYFDQLAGILLEDLLDRILWCTTQGSEQLARSATQGIQVLLAKNGDRFTPAMWDVCVRGIQTMFDSSTPTELFKFDSSAALESDKPAGQKFNFHRVMIKCVVQLELIQAVQNVVLLEKPAFGTPPVDAVRRPSQPNVEPEGLFPSINMTHLTTVLECLKKSNELAAQFNANYELRTAVWKAGFMKQLPNLYKQETSSLQVSMGLLCRMYEDTRYASDWDEIGARLMEIGRNILQTYVAPGDDRQRDIWAPNLAYFLSKVLAFGHERFALHVAEYYDSLVDMLALEMGPDLRTVLRGIFRRVGDEYLKASLKPTVAAAV